MGMKPRIVITIVTETSSLEFSHVKGRETADGTPAEAPTDEMYAIANKAITDLCNVSGKKKAKKGSR